MKKCGVAHQGRVGNGVEIVSRQITFTFPTEDPMRDAKIREQFQGLSNQGWDIKICTADEHFRNQH